jgi:hypothetical protein
MWFAWAVATALLSHSTCVVAIRATPLALYDFAAADCAASDFRDSAVPAALGGLAKGSAVACRTNYGVGVTASTSDSTMQLRSVNPILPIKAQLAATAGFSIELWLKHAVTDNSNSAVAQAILSISSQTAPSPASCDNGSNLEFKRLGTSYAVTVQQSGSCASYTDNNMTAVVEGQGA